MKEHFNIAIEGLGDALFGEECSADKFKEFFYGLEEEDSKKF